MLISAATLSFAVEGDGNCSIVIGRSVALEYRRQIKNLYKQRFAAQ